MMWLPGFCTAGAYGEESNKNVKGILNTVNQYLIYKSV